MFILTQFKNNLIHPKKAAFFRLQRIQRNIGYLFFLSLVMTLFALPQLYQGTGIVQSAPIVLQPFFILFYYVCIAIVFFLTTYGLATIGIALKKIVSRRLTFSHLWSMAANSITWPTVVYGFIELTFNLGVYSYVAFIGVAIIIYTIMIKAIPKPRSRKNPS